MSRVVREMEEVDQRGQGNIVGSARNIGNGEHNQRSHLQLFGQAKKQIDDIFKEIGEYVQETDMFVDEIGTTFQGILPADVRAKVKGYKEKVQGIREVIQRKGMKAVVLGRTSNGKSTVINAMLRDEIVPSEMGHTTHCFIQVEGSDSREEYLLTEGSDQPKNIELLNQLAHNLSDQRLTSNSLIRIMWPKDKCHLLKEDVVLVDSPGIDVDRDLDSWIERYCLDADVFVLVANAESTLTQTEKDFFHKVSSRLSRPNIFVLQNRWDMSTRARNVENVRRQHMERSIEFFVDELRVFDRETAENRVFFVSAYEALVSRQHQDNGTPTPSDELKVGFEERLSEFARFENQFEQSISTSAVRTKLEQHTESGTSITSDVRGIMEQAYNTIMLRRVTDLSPDFITEEQGDELDDLVRELADEVKDEIEAMVEEVKRTIDTVRTKGSERLSLIVKQYDRPFDAVNVEDYKMGLNARVEEEQIGRDLKKAFLKYRTIETRMAERLSSILPNEMRAMLDNLIPTRNDEPDCRNLCVGFKENLKLTVFSRPSRLLQSNVTGSAAGAAAGAAAWVAARSAAGIALGVAAGAAASFASVLTAVPMTLAVYTILLNKAKKEAFKEQYVDYARNQLTFITSQSSNKNQGELWSTFRRLCEYISQLRYISGKFRSLRNKADRLERELNTFVETYLRQSSV